MLVSPDSSFVNGAIVTADGGWAAYRPTVEQKKGRTEQFTFSSPLPQSIH